MLSYVKKFHDTKLVFDLSNDIVNSSEFEHMCWTSSEFGYIIEEGLDTLKIVCYSLEGFISQKELKLILIMHLKRLL